MKLYSETFLGPGTPHTFVQTCFCTVSNKFIKNNFWTRFRWTVVCDHPVLKKWYIHGIYAGVSTLVSKSSPTYILLLEMTKPYVSSSSSHLLNEIQNSLDFQEVESLSRRTSVMVSTGNFSSSK